VVVDELSSAQVEALQAMHARIFDLNCTWAQHLEGSYFPKDVIRQHEDCSRLLWYLDNGHRSLIQSTHCNTAVVRWVVRQNGIALAGPPPDTLVDPIPVAALRREIRATMLDWGNEILSDPEHYNNRFYQGFIMLSYCRMLHSLHIGSVASKRAGAEWAKANLDPSWRDLIDRTWATRPVPEVSVRTPADPEDFRRTLEFVREAVAAADRLMRLDYPVEPTL
jgi:Aminoglycoside adenylyltransferase, C-terminal domain